MGQGHGRRPAGQGTETVSDFVQGKHARPDNDADRPAIMGRRLARIWGTMSVPEQRAALRAFARSLSGQTAIEIQLVEAREDGSSTV
ncbi:hypothetical protein ACIQ7Q_34250 [Streptomyces sp. NPDC096176]|uniref:hypothetical protein n=1 Tax=Streptomyces sp. NPDC096176 TaxID=3366079 RepID=UPI003830F986